MGVFFLMPLRVICDVTHFLNRSGSGSEPRMPSANVRRNPTPVGEPFYNSISRPAPFRRPMDQDIDPRLSGYDAYIYDGTHSRPKLSSTRASGMDEQDGEEADGEGGSYGSRLVRFLLKRAKPISYSLSQGR